MTPFKGYGHTNTLPHYLAGYALTPLRQPRLLLHPTLRVLRRLQLLDAFRVAVDLRCLNSKGVKCSSSRQEHQLRELQASMSRAFHRLHCNVSMKI